MTGLFFRESDGLGERTIRENGESEYVWEQRDETFKKIRPAPNNMDKAKKGKGNDWNFFAVEIFIWRETLKKMFFAVGVNEIARKSLPTLLDNQQIGCC